MFAQKHNHKNDKKKPIEIVIVGTGGHGRDVLFTAFDCSQYEVIGFIDDDDEKHGKIINGIKVLGGLEWFDDHRTQCIVAINDTKSRKRVVNKLIKKRVKFCTLIHPSVILPNSVKIGIGCMIQAGSVFASNVAIKNHVIINLVCTIGHDSVLEDYVSLAPGVHINGNNRIKKGVFLGSGAVTKQGLTINEWSTIGMGTVLINDVPKFSLSVGVPGKVKKKT